MMEGFASLAEEKIREAMNRGEFDHLPGKGKPLPPDDLAGVPEELRLGFKLLKNAGMIPEEMLLRKEMVTLEDLLATCQEEGERTKLRGELSVKQLRYQSLMASRSWHSSAAYHTYEQQIQDKLAGTVAATCINMQRLR